MLDNDLVDQNLHSAFEIVLCLENGFGRIVRLERPVRWPIEIAALTLVVCIRKLQQSFTAHGRRAFRIAVTDARMWIQSGFSTCKRLEKISPKCAFVRRTHLEKPRAESTHALGDLGRKHFGGQRLLDDVVPCWIPRRPTEFGLFDIDRG